MLQWKNNDNQIILTYDKNYKPVTFHMQGKLTDDNSDDIISSKVFSIFSDNYMQYTDVRTFIADAKSYFENHGGSWKEIFDKNDMTLGVYR